MTAGDMRTQLNLLLTTGRGKVVASPTVTTYNNIPTEFYSPTTYNSFFPDPSPAESVLVITPKIAADDSITLNARLQLLDESGIEVNFDGTVTYIDGNWEQVLVKQMTSLVSTIKSGETLVFGRLIRKQDPAINDNVPLLGNLPIITSLYKSSTVNANDSELLIFITATFVPEPVPGSSARSITHIALGNVF
jgi:type II secretory pathway component GspD/PulD (secretin)